MHPTVAYLARLSLQARALHPPHEEITIGTITLLPHQVAAVHWLQHRIERFGGALLADPPGLGKTFVALAIAALRGVRPLVIAPAALRSRWSEAALATGLPIEFVSTERLSAPAALRVGHPAFVIIDEAHHLRTASTRRYRRTATLCERARVLLLTATPIHNRPQDLEQITALFHLPPARASVSALRTLTLRRTIEQIHAARLGDGSLLHLPQVAHHGQLALPARISGIARAITRVPALADSDRDGQTLLTIGFLHALQSSDAACASRVRHRIAVTLAVEQAARAQVLPTPVLRRAWTAGDDAVQLAMPELLSARVAGLDEGLAERAARQRAALERLLPLLDGSADARRAVALRRLARWCARPVVAFTQFAATAEALYQRLRGVPGIALLSGVEAQIASGVVRRDEVLARLLSPDRRAHTAVRLLLTTDVLSEGLSLAGVATVVHLDLPWTAARLDQRVGRAARLGSMVPVVRVWHLPASVPTGTTRRLHVLLRRKRGSMEQFEERPDDDLACIALARTLAAGATGSRPEVASRLVTVYSSRMSGHRMRTLALVRMLGRRQIVAHDDGWLRAPSHDDWLALQHAVRWRAGASIGAFQTLEDLIREHVDDEEMRRMLEGAHDERLVARRAADGRLLDASAQQRLALAPRVTVARHDLTKRTSVRDVRDIPLLMEALESKADLHDLAGRTLRPADDRILFHCVVVVRPA